MQRSIQNDSKTLQKRCKIDAKTMQNERVLMIVFLILYHKDIGKFNKSNL